MAYRNDVFLSGRVASEIKQRGNGPYRFQIQQGGGPKKTKPGEYWPRHYFNVNVWPRQSELVELVTGLRNGQEIEVAGRLQTEEWEKDGVKQRSVSITAEAITLPERMPPPLTPDLSRRESSLEITDDDIPF